MKVLRTILIILIVLALAGTSGFLFYQNRNLSKAYEGATTQVSDLTSKLNAIGQLTDVYSVKAEVAAGQEIKEEDLSLMTVPVSAVPKNAITDKDQLIGAYYRIECMPGAVLSSSLICREEFEGAVYDRDLFFDSLPVGLTVGDYIDIRVVLPGGEEFVVLPHKRVNARYENAIKLHLDEEGLWKYTSMMVDSALYKNTGLKIYCTKYVDPGRDQDVVAYYPVRREVTDIMNINNNLIDTQRAAMFNDALRNSIDAKLKYYRDVNQQDAALIASGNSDEHSRVQQAEAFYKSLIQEISTGESTKNADGSDRNEASTQATDGMSDGLGGSSVVNAQEQLESSGQNLNDDEALIE